MIYPDVTVQATYLLHHLKRPLHQRRMAREGADELVIAWLGWSDEINRFGTFGLENIGVIQYVRRVGYVVHFGAVQVEL